MTGTGGTFSEGAIPWRAAGKRNNVRGVSSVELMYKNLVRHSRDTRACATGHVP